jgi:feruloyl esterase
MFRMTSFSLVGSALAGIVMAGGFAGALASQTGMASPPAAAQSPLSVPKADRCAALTGMKVDAGVVEGAEGFAAGAPITGGATPGAKASVGLCRARLSLSPVPGSQIRVEVWLPGNWNGKMLGLGGGGFDGGLSAGAAGPLNRAVGQGYGVVATDVGHTPAPTPETWIHEQPEKVVDFGHRGNHLAAVVAKQLIAAYYGEPAKRAYFVGCSNGGRDGIMEVSRYPQDYDGVVAGAPALRYLEVLTQLIWYNQAVHGPGGAPGLPAKQKLVHDAIMKQCDRLDGVKDGILENPRLCRFDPAVLQCRGADAPDCLTPAEVGAFRKIYAGPKLRDGQQVISGPALGSEGVPGNWEAWVTGIVPGIAGQEFYRWMVYDDPQWKIANFDLNRDYPLARARIAPVINADNPDISAFTRRGGKLIIYQGWDDPAITAASTIKYYEDVRRHIGPKAAGQLRLFMVPGMMHCGGGPGATSFDMQAELENWIERGKAPERVIAVKPESGEPPLSHPLCSWPMTAHYNGSGSTRDAANFTCRRSR